MPPTTTAPRASRREWLGLAVLALPCLLYSMDLTVLHLALPSLSAALQPSATELLWIIDIYGFLVAGLLIPMGTLGDRIGRRRLLLLGALAFGLTSLLAAFATSTTALIASRALLGVAGATVAPSTLSLIRSMFHDPRQRTTAIGWWISSYSIGGAIGPLVGGVVLEFFWWGAVFLLAVPVMALLLVLGPLLLPEARDPAAGRPDLTSAALALVAVLTVIFGLKQLAQHGPGWLPLLAISGGLMLGALFLRRQARLADPLLDLQLFRSPGFGTALAAYGLGMLVVFGGFLFLPQYLQLVRGLSPLIAGLWTVPWAVAFVVGSNLTPRLAGRVRPGVLMAGGLALAAAGLVALARLDGETPLGLFVVASIAFALGLAPLFTLTTDLVLGAAPPERAGAAAGLSETAAEFSGALGIALFGSLGVAIYRLRLDATLPTGLPAAGAAARETLGGALALAATLPEPLAGAVVAAARQAFVDGLQLTAAISAVGTLGLALMILLLLRCVPASPSPGAPHDTEAQPAEHPWEVTVAGQSTGSTHLVTVPEPGDEAR